jgi:predicted DCC family thiol-disulfide oxidoreductase YuxK
MSDKQNILFFDGVCNLCNASVQIMLKNDKKGYYQFASLQSDFATQFFKEKQYTPVAESLILFSNNRFYHKSDAALKVAGHLAFPYPLLSVLFIFPSFIRNPVYDFIARNRYKWFGKRESCMIPERKWVSRFIG